MSVDTELEHFSTFVHGEFADISTAASHLFCNPVAGKLRRIQVVLAGAITVANATVTVKNGAGTVIATLVVPFSGSGANVATTLDVKEDAPLAAGELVQVETDGGSTTAAKAAVCVWVKRN